MKEGKGRQRKGKLSEAMGEKLKERKGAEEKDALIR